MGDDSEWMKLPVDQKCEHKVSELRMGNDVILIYFMLQKSTYIHKNHKNIHKNQRICVGV